MLEDITTASLFAFFLVFCRLAAGIMLLPGFSESYISPKARLVIALGVALVITPMTKQYLPPMPSSMFELIIIVSGEIIVGLFIGAVIKIILSSMHVAGMVISYQSGLAAATLFDPNQQTQGSIIGVFLTTLAVFLIFATNLHHIFLMGLIDSYKIFSPIQPMPIGGFSELISKTVAGSFLMGVKIAAPQIVIGLVLYLGAGIMARLMPQMQVFFVMMPVQIALGFFILMISLSAGMLWFMEYYREVLTNFV